MEKIAREIEEEVRLGIRSKEISYNLKKNNYVDLERVYDHEVEAIGLNIILITPILRVKHASTKSKNIV